MLRIRFDQFLWILPLLGMLASGKSTAASEMASTGTRFEGSAFACTGVSAYPDDQMLVAVTEESKLLSDIGINLHCADNFQDLDFNNPPWGQKDNQHFLSKVYDLIEFIS
ncbi:MAG: hypothetical protein NTX25_11640, partial [Proteobacteria bacterium]|nr:hypothetical protein [Pseudomonadota bacterium]